jgi:hypothetical protein
MRYIFFFILLFFSVIVSGQNSFSNLRNKILLADSVLLISHASTSLKPRSEMSPTQYRLILNGKVNQKIIIERKIVKGKSLQYLSKLIGSPFKDKTLEKGHCFNPRNTIFIYKAKRISFIDICFECREIESSKDIKIPENDFDNLIWEKLEYFFKEQGFVYGFDTPSTD